MHESVAVAVSGGVDSLFSLMRLQAEGLKVMALHARFLPSTPERDPVPRLADACARLHVPLHVVDLCAEFEREVVEPFAQAYARCATPNPCAWCNVRMKFGRLWAAAQELGASRLATGHYAALAEHPVYGTVLRRACDATKDQSYFLALVPRERLERALFPLATLHKIEVVAAMEQGGIPVPLPGESQEICFVPHDDYREFLRSRSVHGVALPGPGPVCLQDGRTLGQHAGLWQYTEGQRRGLGLAWSEPLYVLDKDAPRNVLVVGSREQLDVQGCIGHGVNELVPRALWPEQLMVRTRYRQTAVPASVLCVQDRLEARFHAPHTPAAPGQIMVIYDTDGHVLAGAHILCNIR